MKNLRSVLLFVIFYAWNCFACGNSSNNLTLIQSKIYEVSRDMDSQEKARFISWLILQLVGNRNPNISILLDLIDKQSKPQKSWNCSSFALDVIRFIDFLEQETTTHWLNNSSKNPDGEWFPYLKGERQKLSITLFPGLSSVLFFQMFPIGVETLDVSVLPQQEGIYLLNITCTFTCKSNPVVIYFFEKSFYTNAVIYSFHITKELNTSFRGCYPETSKKNIRNILPPFPSLQTSMAERLIPLKGSVEHTAEALEKEIAKESGCSSLQLTSNKIQDDLPESIFADIAYEETPVYLLADKAENLEEKLREKLGERSDLSSEAFKKLLKEFRHIFSDDTIIELLTSNTYYLKIKRLNNLIIKFRELKNSFLIASSFPGNTDTPIHSINATNQLTDSIKNKKSDSLKTSYKQTEKLPSLYPEKKLKTQPPDSKSFNKPLGNKSPLPSLLKSKPDWKKLKLRPK